MTGAANMRTLARQLEKVPDEAVAELVRWFVPRSEEVGGRMLWFGKRVQLSSRIRSRKGRNSSGSVVIGGTPVSCWSIKSYGRKGNYGVRPKRKEALHLSSVVPGAFFSHVSVKSPTSGDRRWDRLVREADQRFPGITVWVIDRTVFR